jgi:formylglycine-generating enzyme required for sulfatase activity
MSGSQDKTPEGIFDLAGNVGEWVDTVFKDGLDEELQSSRLQLEQPIVIRGGAYNKAFLARATARSHRLAFNVAFNVGFRCAKTITTGN